MGVQLEIEYEKVMELAEQLPQEQREHLISRLIARRERPRELTVEEKIALFNSLKLDNPVNETPSIRREDWYDDEGR